MTPTAPNRTRNKRTDQAARSRRPGDRQLTLGVVISVTDADTRPTDDALSALASASRRGIDLDIVLAANSDRANTANSGDDLNRLAETHGARLVVVEGPRSALMTQGAKEVRGDWLLFLHAGTLLDRGWDATIRVFASEERNRERGAVFTYASLEEGPAGRRAERQTARRIAWFGLSYGDQALVLHRRFLSRIGGILPIARAEDLEICRRIGIARTVMFDVRAFNPPTQGGKSLWLRGFRNALHILRLPISLVARIPT